jgi:hypothetical protein
MSGSSGHKASVTKGHDEEVRAGRMAARTRENGKDNAQNPYSRANCNPPTQRMLDLAAESEKWPE